MSVLTCTCSVHVYTCQTVTQLREVRYTLLEFIFFVALMNPDFRQRWMHFLEVEWKMRERMLEWVWPWHLHEMRRKEEKGEKNEASLIFLNGWKRLWPFVIAYFFSITHFVKSLKFQERYFLPDVLYWTFFVGIGSLIRGSNSRALRRGQKCPETWLCLTPPDKLLSNKIKLRYIIQPTFVSFTVPLYIQCRYRYYQKRKLSFKVMLLNIFKEAVCWILG